MTDTNNPQTVNTDFVISRTFNAPRDLVWKVWTDPNHISQWLSPGGGKISVSKMEFRPGGIFHYCMKAPDGSDMWGKWEFREIKAPERLVLINCFSDAEGNATRHPMAPTWPLYMTTTSTLVEQGDKTALTLVWSPFNATEEEQQTFNAAHAGMEQGWGGSFAQLEAYLEKVKKVPEAMSAARKTHVEYPSDREMVFTRTFDAPRDLVWEVWTKPEHVVQWLGPEGFTNTLLELNVKPGGLLRLIMHGPHGVDYPNRMEFIEVVKPSRLVYHHGSDEDNDPARFHVTTEFTDEGGKTGLVTRMKFNTVEQCEETKKYAADGHNSTMGRLDKLLAELQGK